MVFFSVTRMENLGKETFRGGWFTDHPRQMSTAPSQSRCGPPPRERLCLGVLTRSGWVGVKRRLSRSLVTSSTLSTPGVRRFMGHVTELGFASQRMSPRKTHHQPHVNRAPLHNALFPVRCGGGTEGEPLSGARARGEAPDRKNLSIRDRLLTRLGRVAPRQGLSLPYGTGQG